MVNTREVVAWGNKISCLLTKINQEFLERQSEMLDPLHDPIRLARQVESIAQTLVQEDGSSLSLDEQVDKASPNLKALVKAAGLLTDSFDLLTIFFNPESASYGRKSSISLHGLLLKLVRIFSIQDVFEEFQDSVRIFLSGKCYRSVFVYESFKLVPFAIISNAIKYRLDGDVRVNISDRTESVEVSIESIGPFIEPGELRLIFNRKFRGKWADKVAVGTGVGLYLAKIVADANGFSINVSSKRQGARVINGVPVAVNRFYFELPYGET